MKLKIFGERNTGTKFLRELLRLNGQHDLWPGTIAELGQWDRVAAGEQAEGPATDHVLLREALIDDLFAAAFDRTLGWKHAAPETDRLPAAGTMFLVTVKNPYAWVVSMFRRPHHNLLTGNMADLESFVAWPWLTCGRDNLPHRLGSVVELWNLKYRAWLRLGDNFPALVIRYEDLLLDDAALQPLARRLGLAPDAAWALPATVPNSGDDRAFYTDYYAHGRWREALSPTTIARIGEQLDHALVATLGYHVLTP